MQDTSQFNTDLENALEARHKFIENERMGILKDAFRNFHMSYQNLLHLFIRKALIHEDPYKDDMKISEVHAPEDGPFLESEKQEKMSTRLAQLDAMLEFLNNYYQLSVDFMTLPRIKNLVALVNYIKWDHVSDSSPNMTTRFISEYAGKVRRAGDSLSTGIINDALNVIEKNMKLILTVLKDLTSYQREKYKFIIREKILGLGEVKSLPDPKIPEDLIKIVKRHFTSALPDAAFFPELIHEIFDETFTFENEKAQQAVLDRLVIKQQTGQSKKQEDSFKSILMEAFRSLSTASMHLESAMIKLDESVRMQENRRQTLSEKFRLWVMSMTGHKHERRIYELEMFDTTTAVSKNFKLNYDEFSADVNKKIKLLTSFGNKMTPAYHKLEASVDEDAFRILDMNIEETLTIHRILSSLDIYFKSEVDHIERGRIRGIKIELTSLKNSIMKANQKRHDYVARKEEIEQMKKLGIKSE